jgi:hypothetical protein
LVLVVAGLADSVASASVGELVEMFERMREAEKPRESAPKRIGVYETWLSPFDLNFPREGNAGQSYQINALLGIALLCAEQALAGIGSVNQPRQSLVSLYGNTVGPNCIKQSSELSVTDEHCPVGIALGSKSYP